MFVLHKRTEMVAAGYRVARYSVTSLESIKSLHRLHIEIFIIRTLTKDSKCHVERIQALKLIRAMFEFPDHERHISLGIVRALVSVCEQSDDMLKNIAIETLAEIFIHCPEIAYQAGGARVLLQCAIDGPYELAPSICMTFLYVLNNPKHRTTFRLDEDLDVLVSPFTDMQIKGHIHTEKLQNSARILSALLTTWPGLIAFCSNNFFALRSLIDCLQYPITTLRDKLMDIFFAILRVKPLSWSTSFLAGRRLTTFGRIADTNLDFTRNDGSNSGVPDSSFTKDYTCLLLAILLHCNLLENLFKVLIDNEDTGNTRRATLLIGELIDLGSNILPQDMLLKLMTFPGLMEATIKKESANALSSSAAIFQIDKVSRNIYKARYPKDSGNMRDSSMSMQVKVKMGIQIDDASFRQLMADTHVLTTKTFTRWNWDVLTELIQGPLLSPKRLEESIKTTKFMKRLMSFYRPFKYRFSSIKKTRPNQKCVKVGMALFKTLLQSKEGIKYLNENKLLSQIAECLAQLDPMSGISSPDPLFSKHRLESTLSSGYFSLLGTLSADPNGMAMMENRNMFNMFYHLSELRSREDLICNFLRSMDFELQGHPRIILAKALTTGQKNVRLFATSHLKNLKNTKEATQKWAITLLVTQLYDLEVEVCKLAVEVLEEYCKERQNLEYFVELQPSLDHLGEIGNPLLLKFLSISKGFQYLKELEYVHQEMDNWFHGQNENYVGQIEEYLERAYAPWPSLGREKDSISTIVPRHFYGEVTLTEEGCQLLKNKGHFEIFCRYIKNHKDMYLDLDHEKLRKLKGCLWAVGHAGSNTLGSAFLESSGVITDITCIAEKSQISSLKGTAFYVLGLISSTIEGLEILDELGWSCVCKNIGQPSGICIPVDLNAFFNSQFNALSTSKDEQSIEDMKEVEFPSVQTDAVRRSITEALSNLSNQILANDASKQLVELSRKHGERFRSIDQFLEALTLIENYKYKLPIRKFIFELFDSDYLLEKLTSRKALSTSGRKNRNGTGESRKSMQSM